MKFSALFLWLLTVGFLLLISLANPASSYGQGYYPPTANPNLTPNTNPDVPQNLHTYTQSVFIELAGTAICHLAGVDVLREDGKCLGIDPKTKKIGFVENGGGLIGLTGNMIAGTFALPVSSGDYFAYLSSSFGIAKPAYAQGIGFEGLKPLLEIWRVIRDVVYLLFVIAFIALGLGIMFRIQIDPRTVMTIQNQIPKIIVILVLVTFSYAIAGFFIDLMWVSTYLAVSILSQASPDIANATTYLSQNPLEFANNAVNIGFGGIFSIISQSASTVSSIIAEMTNGSFISWLIGSLVAFMTTGPIGPAICIALQSCDDIGSTALGGVGYVIAWAIIFIAILFSLFRLWFALIKAYVYILVGATLSPIWIMLGILPITQAGFGNWLRHMVSYLSVFPTTVVMLLFAKILMTSFTNSANPFIPPLVGNTTNITGGFAVLLGLGVILLTPEVVNIVKEALRAPEFKYLSAIGRGVGTGTGVISGTAGQSLSTAATYTFDITGARETQVEKGIGRTILRMFR